MRTRIVGVLAVLITALSIGCTSTVRDFTFRYSFLDTPEVRDFVAASLAADGFPDADIRLWMAQIDRYNTVCETFVSRAGSGWVYTGLRGYAAIDFRPTIDFWYDAVIREINDTNCRTSLFLLLKNRLEYRGPPEAGSGDGDPVAIEEESADAGNTANPRIPSDPIDSEIRHLRGREYFDLDPANERIYADLFGSIDLDEHTGTDESASRIEREWENRGVVLRDSDVGLIRVVGVSIQTRTAVVLHTGIVFSENGRLYFVEKKNPCYPFQISEFADRDQLVGYLQTVFREVEGGILIFENNRPMER